MELIARFVLLSLLKIVSPAIISSTEVIPLKNEDLKTSNSIIKMTPASFSSTTVIPLRNEDLKTGYQVTENIKDIPDNRTLAPIVPNFGLVTALNFGNNSIAIANNNIEQNSGSSEYSGVDKNKTSNNDGSLKKNSFSILHIKAEYDEKPVMEHHNVFGKVFGGIKSYVYNLKKGVVDGLHSFFHHHDNKPDREIENHDKHKFHKYDKFHRSFDGVEDFDDEQYYDDSESSEHFSHY